MPIHFVTGDLFANRFKAQALAHGCNCEGSMGAGIATQFRGRYPEMYEEYRRRCKATSREFNLGDSFLWKASDGKPYVFNLGTQEGVWRAKASYDAIENALKSMLEQANREHIGSIAMPRVGAGYGGLTWKKVRQIIEEVFGDRRGALHVYEEYAQEEGSGGSVPAIVVESRRRKRTSIEKAWPSALIADVTLVFSNGEISGGEKGLGFIETALPFLPSIGLGVPEASLSNRRGSVVSLSRGLSDCTSWR